MLVYPLCALTLYRGNIIGQVQGSLRILAELEPGVLHEIGVIWGDGKADNVPVNMIDGACVRLLWVRSRNPISSSVISIYLRRVTSI